MSNRPGREQVMVAQFDAFQAAPSIKATGMQTFGRRGIPWVQAPAQPALFFRGSHDDYVWDGTNLQLALVCEVWLYGRTGPTDAPDTVLNALLEALEGALDPDEDDMRYTIGGLVFWCRLNGRVDRYLGDLGTQAIAIAELEIILP